MPAKCRHRECSKQPSFGQVGTKKAENCAEHAKHGMVNVVSKRCIYRGCTKHPSFGMAGTKRAELCSKHAKDGMVRVSSRRTCGHEEGCTKQPSYGVAGTKRAEFCAVHSKRGMINVFSKKCGHNGCIKFPSFGVAGLKKGRVEFCAEHAKDGMVAVYKTRCGQRGCTKHSSYGVAGTKKVAFCAEHAKDGMVNVLSKRCDHTECTKQPSYGVAGTKRVVFCAEHAKGWMVDVRKGCGQRGRSNHPSYDGAGTNKGENLAKQAKEGMMRLRSNGENGRGSCRGERGTSVSSGTTRRVGAGDKRKRGAFPPIQAESSSGNSGGVNKRARRTIRTRSVTSSLARVAAAENDGRVPVDEIHASESDDAVKSELAMPWKVEPSEAEGVSTLWHIYLFLGQCTAVYCGCMRLIGSLSPRNINARCSFVSRCVDAERSVHSAC